MNLGRARSGLKQNILLVLSEMLFNMIHIKRGYVYISSPIGWVVGCTAKMTFNPKKVGCSELPEKLAGQFEVQRSCQINKVANINCDIATLGPILGSQPS